MPQTYHVISHTHWDREWYLTYQQFRLRLVNLIDNLLALLDRDPNFLSFNLDAQTIVLEDYLAVKPTNRSRLEAYIRAGRITIGPWYQLNDEFLTSGESTIRSLLVGTRIARSFGACLSIGYLPDQFGNLSQMPQIFRGFGIDNAIFGRGYQLDGERKMEFIWESPDGSDVTASLMAFWYNNAQHFPADPREALAYTLEIRDRMAPVSAVSHLLLMNGVDHLEAQQDLSPILAALQPLLPAGDRLIHSTVQAYMDALKAEVEAKQIQLQRHSGELREDRGGSCLAGTLSTRMYLKQANHQAQLLLEKFTEPFAVFGLQAGADYPYEFLLTAWKLLMQNHPHDSICGCSIDEVHREMVPRFAQVEQIGAELICRSLQAVADQAALPGAEQPDEAAVGLVVFNSLNWARTDPVRVTLVFPLGIPTRGSPPRDDSLRVAGFTLRDEQGVEIPFAVSAQDVVMRQVLSPVELPLDQWVQQVSIEFIAADVPACGYKTYRVNPCALMPVYDLWEGGPEDGWQPVFEDCGDVGDEYLHRKPECDLRIEQPVQYGGPMEERNAVRYSRFYVSSLNLPAAAVGLEGRAEELTACHTVTQVTRWRNSDRLEYETTFDNQARDHRLRVVFQNHAAAPFQALPFSSAEGQFDVVRRPLVDPLAAEGASTFYPQQNWVALSGTYGGQPDLHTIAVLNQGLPEYEIYPAAHGGAQIAVTLLRGVTYISRRGDGPQMETPEAQCIGVNTYRYALLETRGGWEEGAVWKQAGQYNVPLRAVQTDGAGTARSLPTQLSFATLTPDTLVLTALKRAEDDPRQVILRFYNISDQAVVGGVGSLSGAVSAAYVNLNEEVLAPLPLDEDGRARLKIIRPKEIVTLAFTLHVE